MHRTRRFVRLAPFVSLGLLLAVAAAGAIPGCADDGGGSTGDDAGGHDSGVIGHDATADGAHPLDDASTGNADAHDDATLPDGGADAHDGAPADAADAGSADGSDAASPVDASDASSAADASDAASPVDASDASSAVDASDAASPVDAADAATCVATCQNGISYFGSSAAFITGGRQLTIQNDTIPAGSTVSAITQTYPMGAAKSVHAVYTTDGFASTTDLTLTYDHQVGNNDQWYVVLPAEAAGTTVTWYLYADGCDCVRQYDSAGGANFHYSSQ